jgi:hypothetical protein
MTGELNVIYLRKMGWKGARGERGESDEKGNLWFKSRDYAIFFELRARAR